MKIAVVGCGALGSYYGARLCRDGQDIHLLLRSDYEIVRRQGMLIRSPAGDFRVHPNCAQRPEAIGPCDLVLIGLKTTANDQFAQLLPPLVSRHTLVLTLQNGLGNEENLAALFGAQNILGGLCFVCLNRLEPGVIQHIDHGKVVLGEFRRASGPRTHEVASMFHHAGVTCEVTDDLERTHWEKLVWNIPFNGLGVASGAGHEALISGALGHDGPLGPCLDTGALLADPKWERLVRELMLEVIAAANGLGLKIPRTLAENQIARTRTMGAYKASTLIDFERGKPLEIESLFAEPLRQARTAGVVTPRLAALCSILQRLDRK